MYVKYNAHLYVGPDIDVTKTKEDAIKRRDKRGESIRVHHHAYAIPCKDQEHDDYIPEEKKDKANG